MKSLSDNEIDEIESIKYLIKYANTDPYIEDHELFEVVMKLNELGKKYVLSELYNNEEFDKILEIDDMKDLIEKFMNMLIKALEKK